jgi:hypothetical protein
VATRNEQILIYDLLVLEAGAVRYQVTGTISGRHPFATHQRYSAAGTAELHFYKRIHAARQAADYPQLRTLYGPDAVALSPSVNLVVPGREAYLEATEKAARDSGVPLRKAIVNYRDAPGVICAEEVVNIMYAVPEATRDLLNRSLGAFGRPVNTPRGPGFDVLTYEVLILRSGAVRYQFSGMIKPRFEELLGMRKERSDAVFDAWRTSNRMLANRWWQ